MNNQNQKAFETLKNLGYPLHRIRQALLQLNGASHQAIAKEAGVSRASVSQHIAGLRTNDRLLKQIADYLGVVKEDFFPEL